jgi:hypothetical protein
MIRGIGPVYAKNMVKAFGEKVFDVIEAESHSILVPCLTRTPRRKQQLWKRKFTARDFRLHRRQ